MKQIRLSQLHKCISFIRNADGSTSKVNDMVLVMDTYCNVPWIMLCFRKDGSILAHSTNVNGWHCDAPVFEWYKAGVQMIEKKYGHSICDQRLLRDYEFYLAEKANKKIKYHE